ncbi:MAG TPA: glycosyltransferase [Terracidiphilus sp.]|nr:glycosyltransferase [Terracidiphilus sp.]
MARRVRVLFLIPHLGGGGAERVISLLAAGVSADKYEVHLGLVTRADAGDTRLPPWVTIHSLGARRVRCAALGLLGLVRGLKPDIILSGIAHLNLLVLLLRPFFSKKAVVLVRQNATVSSALAMSGVPTYTRCLYRLLYGRADRVICQSRAMAADLIRELNLREELVTVLPNPVNLEEIRRARSSNVVPWPLKGPHLLAIGRLAPEKGFDLLLVAFATVRAVYPGASLALLGAGTEEAALRTLCHELGLDEAVRFYGYVSNPYAFFRGTTLFALPSRHEGMPSALLEAVVAGLPIVASPCSGGVVDFLRGHTEAWIAPATTAEGLAKTLLEAFRALGADGRLGQTFAQGPSPRQRLAFFPASSSSWLV